MLHVRSYSVRMKKRNMETVSSFRRNLQRRRGANDTGSGAGGGGGGTNDSFRSKSSRRRSTSLTTTSGSLLNEITHQSSSPYHHRSQSNQQQQSSLKNQSLIQSPSPPIPATPGYLDHHQQKQLNKKLNEFNDSYTGVILESPKLVKFIDKQTSDKHDRKLSIDGKAKEKLSFRRVRYVYVSMVS